MVIIRKATKHRGHVLGKLYLYSGLRISRCKQWSTEVRKKRVKLAMGGSQLKKVEAREEKGKSRKKSGVGGRKRTEHVRINQE